MAGLVNKIKVLKPAPLTAENAQAVRAWNIMKGMDWNALSTVLEYIDASNAEFVIRGLIQIQTYQEKLSELKRLNSGK